MDLSIIIPCHGRIPALIETLEHLRTQILESSRFEVIVVDDGSPSAVAPCLEPHGFPYAITVLRQASKGAARARNLGADQGRAPVLLFLDADIIASPQLAAEHLHCHQQHEHALVAGRRLPWPAARQTLFAQLLDLDGNFLPGQPCTFQQVFSANFSIPKRDFLAQGGFDDRFPMSGYEDIDFAYRCVEAGLELVCCPEAVGYHNHPATLRQACHAARQYQRSAALLLFKHPQLRGQIDHLQDKQPISWKSDPLSLIARKIARRMLALHPVIRTMERTVALLERRWPHPGLLRFFYWKILGSYQLLGLRDGILQYGW